MTESRGVLLDDNREDLKIAGRLTRAGFPCDGLLAPGTLDALREELHTGIASGKYTIALLDYRLDAEHPDGPDGFLPYRGGTVAAELKEQFPDTPVVLITTEEKLQASLRHNPRVRTLFDHVILKGALTSRSGRVAAAAELKDLDEGFGLIRRKIAATQDPEPWQLIFAILDVKEDERAALTETVGAHAPEGVAEISQWLLAELLVHPGILLDEDEASYRVGLEKGSFRRDEVESLFAGIRYSGPFAQLRPRWWRGRLAARLREVAGDDAFGDSKSKARKIAEAIGANVRSLRPAACVWCAEPNVARACMSCREPVDSLHSLVVRAPDQPKWAEPLVACFRCIQEGRVEGATFQPGTDDIVRDLRTGKLRRPSVTVP